MRQAVHFMPDRLTLHGARQQGKESWQALQMNHRVGVDFGAGKLSVVVAFATTRGIWALRVFPGADFIRCGAQVTLRTPDGTLVTYKPKRPA